ncbi:hypothetical protein Tco_0724169 [Tanacetum coccineum]
MQDNSEVKSKKTEVEDHHRIFGISNKTKSVTACNDSLKVRTSNVNDIVQLILFIVESGCTKHMTGNLKLLCNFIKKYLGTVHFGNDQFALILVYGDLVKGNIMIKRKDIVNGLPKLKYVNDQLCSSCELGKAKKSTFKTKAVPSLKGRLNLLHMDLCGPMRVESINGKKYILASDYDNSSPVPQLQKTSVPNSTELGTHDHINEPLSSMLVPNVSPSADTDSSQ